MLCVYKGLHGSRRELVHDLIHTSRRRRDATRVTTRWSNCVASRRRLNWFMFIIGLNK